MNGATELAKRESKGGIGFDLVLEQPTGEAPPTIKSPTATRHLTQEDIESKLKAAEERRESLEAQKLQKLKEKDNLINEFRNKRNELENSFKEEVRVTIESKLEKVAANRDALEAQKLQKLKEHEQHIEEVRQNKEVVSKEAASEQ